MINRISIVYVAHNDLVDVLSVSIISVLYHAKSAVNFYLIDVGIDQCNKEIINQIAKKFDHFGEMKFISVDLEKNFGKFPRFKGRFLDTYARILIPELLLDVKKCLYLDSDTIVLGDLTALFNYDLDGLPLGAVPDLWWFGLPDDKASLDNIKFSSGVLLIDCEKWRNEGITRQVIQVGLNNIDMVVQSGLYDMFTMNLYFSGNKFKVLQGRYNFIGITTIGVPALYGLSIEDIENEACSCVIRHFSGTKPWTSDTDQHYGTGKIRNFENWWFFAAMSPFCEALKMKFILSNACKNIISSPAIDNPNINPADMNILRQALKSKYHLYKLLQFLTFGLVKKFIKRKEEYRKRYKAACL